MGWSAGTSVINGHDRQSSSVQLDCHLSKCCRRLNFIDAYLASAPAKPSRSHGPLSKRYFFARRACGKEIPWSGGMCRVVEIIGSLVQFAQFRQLMCELGQDRQNPL